MHSKGILINLINIIIFLAVLIMSLLSKPRSLFKLVIGVVNFMYSCFAKRSEDALKENIKRLRITVYLEQGSKSNKDILFMIPEDLYAFYQHS